MITPKIQKKKKTKKKNKGETKERKLKLFDNVSGRKTHTYTDKKHKSTEERRKDERRERKRERERERECVWGVCSDDELKCTCSEVL